MQLPRLLVAIFIALLATSARAQVTVDVAKITCEQFLNFSVTDPKDISIWLSGYFHGQRGSTIVEPQTFKENFAKINSTCFVKTNGKLPIMQIIEQQLRIGK